MSEPFRACLDCDNQMPLRPGVLEVLSRSLEEGGNPMSRSRRGLQARQRLEDARDALAGMLGAHRSEVWYVSCGSEANTWALERTVMHGGLPPRAIFVSPLEHVSVLAAANARSRREGMPVLSLPLSSSGKIQVDVLRSLFPEPPFFVSVQWANPEVGLLQPIEEIGKVVQEKGGTFHVDFVAAESFVPIRFRDLPVDLLTISSSRWGGPPGIAALLLKKGKRILPLIEGGGQEDGRRGGTQPDFLAAGWERALRHWEENREEEAARLQSLTRDLARWVVRTLKDVRTAGERGERIPGVLNLLVHGIDGQAALSLLDAKGVEVGTGSSCSRDSLKVSHVLSALGYSAVENQGSVVLSMGWSTTSREVDLFQETFPGVIDRLRSLAPALKGA